MIIFLEKIVAQGSFNRQLFSAFGSSQQALFSNLGPPLPSNLQRDLFEGQQESNGFFVFLNTKKRKLKEKIGEKWTKYGKNESEEGCPG